MPESRRDMSTSAKRTNPTTKPFKNAALPATLLPSYHHPLRLSI